MSNLVDNSAFPQYQSVNNDLGLSNIKFPEVSSSPNYTVPMVSLDDQSSSYGRRVLHIDPKLASDKLKEMNTGSYTPAYAQSPMRSNPPLGSVLQTPPDLTPTRVPSNVQYPPKAHVSNLGQDYLGAAQVPRISESINNFLDMLPSAASSPVYMPTPVPRSQPKIEEPQKDRVQDSKEKADYRVKFSILREAYPTMNIPDPKEDESIEEIKAAYKVYVRRIHVDSSVEQNKVYLLILWLIIDIVGSRCFHLPFNGRYVKSQYKYMQKYQMLLIELGERNYTEETDGWPVEYRLLAMAIFHGVIFALVQMLASKLGGAGNAANDKMADEFRETIDNFLTNNKGADVLRRAEQASTDNPVPESVNDNASPPGGDLGAMLANFAPQLMSMFGNLGGAQAEAPKPEMKRPTTFGARRKAKVEEED